MRAGVTAVIACVLSTQVVDGQVAVTEPASTAMQTLSRMAGLTGRIEGSQNGKERGVDYPMRRVACPTP